MTIRFLQTLGLWCLVTAGGAGAEKHTFQLNDQPFAPTIYSLNGTPEEPAAGDVFEMQVVLGPDRDYSFRYVPQDRRLLRVHDHGRTEIVAVNVGTKWDSETKSLATINPLEKLAPAEIGGLRGISLETWSPAVAARLKHLNFEQVCVRITENAFQGPNRSFPELPSSVRYLVVEVHSNMGIKDYSGLARLTSLRCLSIVNAVAPHSLIGIDCAWIKAPELRFLKLFGVRLSNTQELARLSQLRHLDLDSAKGVSTIRFAGSMHDLVGLDLGRTSVTDLSPLADLKDLRRINANSAPLARLPAHGLAGLRRLDVMSTKLTDPAVHAFAAGHPQCQIRHRWLESMQASVKGADRVRVRSGGTCHRDPSSERTLVEVKDASTIATLLQNIDIDEDRSGFECMCCGKPSFEFYTGNNLLTTIGFHHGQGLRCLDAWPADAALTSMSAEFLCRWLAEHGVPEPLKEFDAGQQQARALERRMLRYRTILPADTSARLAGAKSADEGIRAFEETIKDETERARMYLRLYGCTEARWNLAAAMDQPLHEVLIPRISRPKLIQAMSDTADELIVRGTARCLFGDDLWKTLADALPKAAWSAAGKVAVASPRLENRRRAMTAMAARGDADSLEILRSILDEKTSPRKISRDAEMEPGGAVIYRPGDSEIEKGSDQAQAAFLLAKAGDRQSSDAIRALAKKAAGADAELLSQAVKSLKQPAH